MIGSLGILFVALCLSAVAGYFSVVGLAAIFSAAYLEVIIMATILEVAKLSLASWLYQNWRNSPILLKTYLTIAVVVLMGITSLGIFGFLSKAHLDQSLPSADLVAKLELLDLRIKNTKQNFDRSNQQLSQLDESISVFLKNDRATQGLAARQKQQAERNDLKENIDNLAKELDQLQGQRLTVQQSLNQVAVKLGPIKYFAEFVYDKQNVDLDGAVRWMIMTIIFVFDPLAVLMVVAANMGLVRTKPNSVDQKASQTVIQQPSILSVQPVEPIIEKNETFTVDIAKVLHQNPSIISELEKAIQIVQKADPNLQTNSEFDQQNQSNVGEPTVSEPSNSESNPDQKKKTTETVIDSDQSCLNIDDKCNLHIKANVQENLELSQVVITENLVFKQIPDNSMEPNKESNLDADQVIEELEQKHQQQKQPLPKANHGWIS